MASSGNGTASIYFVSPILDDGSAKSNPSMQLRTVDYEGGRIGSFEHKAFTNSGPIHNSHIEVDGKILNRIGSIQTHAAMSFKSEQSNGSDFKIREYVKNEWYVKAPVGDSSTFPPEGWQLCGNGKYLCPAYAGLSSVHIENSGTPLSDLNWLKGTYSSPGASQVLKLHVEINNPQIDTVMLNDTYDYNGNRRFLMNDTIGFDLSIIELYEDIDGVALNQLKISILLTSN